MAILPSYVRLKNLIGGVIDSTNPRGLDAILIGETHIDSKHTNEQIELIKRYKPEFILAEFLNTKNPEDMERIVKYYDAVTLKELAECYDLDIDKLNIGKIALDKYQTFNTEVDRDRKDNLHDGRFWSKIKLKQQDIGGIVPKNIKQLLNTPLYEMDSFVIYDINDALFEARETAISQTKHVSRNADLINKLRVVSTRVSLFSRSNVGPNGIECKGDRLYRIAYKIGAKIAGCDIDKILPKAGDDIFEYAELLNEYVCDKNYTREKTMGERICEFAKLRSNKSHPLVIVVGKKHLSNSNSPMYKVLDEAGLNYKVILQKERNYEVDAFQYTMWLALKNK